MPLDPNDVLTYVLTALGSGGVAAAAMKLYADARANRRDDFKALIEASMATAERAQREAHRANRRLDMLIRCIRSCPTGAPCGALEVLEQDLDEDAEARPRFTEDALVRIGHKET